MSADVVGFSRLMGANEVGTLSALKEIRADLVDGSIAMQGGRIVKLTGDGILAEFPSVVSALQSALAIQQAMLRKNADVPEDRRIQFRIGINLGDIILEEGDIFGDGVNVAARIEALARPGGIAVSGSVREQVGNRLDVAFDSVGAQNLKNIAAPVPIFHVRPQGGETRARGAAGGLPDRPSIAVLPFTNMSGDPEQEYFADGITEDLITDLSKLSGLFVVGRNSVFVYKGKATNLQQVARELGVRHILEGSVRKSGQRLRITGQLIDGVTGGHLWADRYDRELTDIFALQDEITRTIIEQLQVRLLDTETAKPERAPTRNADAYTCVLKGRRFYHMRSRRYLESARRCFLEALERDPNYARAFVGLADCDTRLNDWYGDRNPVEEILAMIRRALEIEPDMADAYAAKGLALQIAGRDDEAAQAYRRALELDPQCYEAHHNFARYHRARKNHADAVRHFVRALEIMPDDYRSPLLAAGDFDALGKRDERDRYLRLGLKRAEEAIMRNPTHTDPLELGAAVLAGSGEHEQAREWLERALELDPDRTEIQGYNFACAYALIGETDQALDWLERIIGNLGHSQRVWMKADPDLDPLRDHPRFIRLLETQAGDVQR